MKVIIIVPDMVVGGVTTVVTNLINYLLLQNIKVIVVTVFDRNEVKTLNCEIISLGVESFKDLPFALIKLKSIVKKIKPDIVHSHTIFSHLLLLLVKKFFLSDLKVICTEHGTVDSIEANTLYMKLFKRINGLANSVTFVSDASLKSYIKYKIVEESSSNYVMYNGVDTNIFSKNLVERDRIRSIYNIDEELIVFGVFGRLATEKNIFLTLKSLNLLKEKVDFKFFLIGEGEEKDSILKMVSDLSLNEKLIYLPFTRDINNYINAIDILCLSSNTEGLPTVIIEAMSCERMIVSTDVGGVGEILDKVVKFISPANDEVEFYNNIVNVVNMSNSDRESIGVAYRTRVLSGFSVNSMCENWKALYELILNNNELCSY